MAFSVYILQAADRATVSLNEDLPQQMQRYAILRVASYLAKGIT